MDEVEIDVEDGCDFVLSSLRLNIFMNVLRDNKYINVKMKNIKYILRKKLLVLSLKWKGREDGFGMKK